MAILDIHWVSYLLNAAGRGALSLHRSWDSLFFTGVVCQQVSCSLHVLKMFPTCPQDVPYMFPTCCGCWPQNLLFIEFVSERPQPGELSQTLLRIFPPFSPTTVPSVSSDSLSGTVSAGTGSWGERWCFAIVYKTRPLDSCNNEAEAQIKAKITGII